MDLNFGINGSFGIAAARPITISSSTPIGMVVTADKGDFGLMKFNGLLAWLLWLFVHIYFITGFNNRIFIFLKWCIAYMTNKKGARIILRNSWRFYDNDEKDKRSTEQS